MTTVSVLELIEYETVNKDNYYYHTIWFTLHQYPNYVLGLRYSPFSKGNKYNIVRYDNNKEDIKINIVELNIRYLPQIKSELIDMIPNSNQRLSFLINPFEENA